MPEKEEKGGKSEKGRKLSLKFGEWLAVTLCAIKVFFTY